MTIDDEVFQDLLQKVEEGAPLRAACQGNGVPDIVLLQRYLRSNPKLLDQLREAKLRAKQRIKNDPQFALVARANRLRSIEDAKNAG